MHPMPLPREKRIGSRNSNRLPYVGLLSRPVTGSLWLAKCRSCGRKSLAPAETILDRFDPLAPLLAVGRHLRCEVCRRVGADLYLAECPTHECDGARAAAWSTGIHSAQDARGAGGRPRRPRCRRRVMWSWLARRSWSGSGV